MPSDPGRNMEVAIAIIPSFAGTRSANLAKKNFGFARSESLRVMRRAHLALIDREAD